MSCSRVAIVLALACCSKSTPSGPPALMEYDVLRDHLAGVGCQLQPSSLTKDDEDACDWRGPCGCYVSISVLSSDHRSNVVLVGADAYGCDEQKVREDIPRWLGIALASDADRELFRSAMARPSFMPFAPEAHTRAVLVTHFGDVSATLDWQPHGAVSSPATSTSCPRGHMHVDLSKTNDTDSFEVDTPMLRGYP